MAHCYWRSKPVKKKDEDDDVFIERLVSWDAMNHQIFTWFRNTCDKVIQLDFRHFDTTKEVWEFLKSRYSVSDDVNQFQLYRRIYRMQQQPTQTIHSYVSTLQEIWD